MIKIDNIQKSFKGNTVLKGIQLEIHEGDLIHIKGINGSGKSTLLKIIAGLLMQDEGSIRLSKGTQIGALIENPKYIETETAVYNLKFLFNLKGTYEESTVKNLFRLFQLDYDLKTPIKKYSIGMRQKVGIIQAIMENQNLVLFDEPTRGLDEASIHAFNEIIKALLRQKKAVIICAHDGVDDIAFTRKFGLENGFLHEL